MRNTDAGFTLLELLVALAITVALAATLLAVSGSALDLFHRVAGNVSGATQARMIFEQLERDLQGAMVRADGRTWLAVDLTTDVSRLATHGWLTAAPRLKPAGPASNRWSPDEADDPGEARFGISGAWLRLVTTQTESGGALPIAVGYQIARRPVSGPISVANPAPVRYTLYRSAVSAAETAVNGPDLAAAAYGSTKSAPGGTRSAATLGNPAADDAFANNVIDFGLWLYARNSDGTLRCLFPADAADISHAALGGATADAQRFPEVADVLVRIVSEEGAVLLENIEAGKIDRPSMFADDGAWWWHVATENSQVFMRRLRVGGP